MEFHPHAETYPMMEGEEYERHRDDIEKNGQRETIKYRIKNRQVQGLDGRNRLKACEELKLKPILERVTVADEEVEEYIDSLNLHRRHLTKETRQVKVKALRAKSMSVRDIAETLDVPKSTVARDVQEVQETPVNGDATVPNGTVEMPETIVGRDGKTRAATNPQPIIFCRPCRVGTPKTNCPGCKAAREKAANKDKPREPGDDSQAEKEEKAAHKRNGKPLFDWKDFDKHFGYVARTPNELVRIFGKDEKSSSEYKDCMSALESLATAAKIWRKRLQKVK